MIYSTRCRRCNKSWWSYIAEYETKGKQPYYDKLKELASHFNVSIDYLMRVSDIKNPYSKVLRKQFKTAEEAIKFILEDNIIMAFGGFDNSKMSDDEIVEFPNDLLNQLQLLG